ncbi:hypothetical protein HPDFL43_05790 [Hoeflea phototrophica DFL-43]|jgi:hypothetical protein|uniref:Uncharacterized protein n=1 Tax=Hoeflea phototrophica (strain DSM 17068 / NCIMB 14078 / DFL-43) TaxID=411684 RepID=A9D4R3_HOEPD|nr:hypothetical protein [Hoeflea phototrophica]EDQ33941.1 hypothetical protein HPDFL43_05790 [Hoeflea phototrophica DFL-43]
MAWTQDDLDKISKAIASGAKRVRFQTHEVEYQSVADMLKARDLIAAEVNPSSARGGAMYAQYESDY